MAQEKTAEKETAKTTTAQKAAQKKYDEKTKMISIKYSPVDMADYERMRAHLEESGLSANQFIKGLIHTYFEEGKPAVLQTAAAATASVPAANGADQQAEGAQAPSQAEDPKTASAAKRSGVLPEWFD
ncbi:MAG: hypothetical protein LUI10_09795 [Lachnospiraceae bacterium]|nr:hypothetical protein [Lachnospiraceae bacterium]